MEIIKRKVGLLVMTVLSVMALMGCSVSDNYLGEWYTIDSKETQMTLHFEKDKVTMGDEESTLEQYGSGFENNVQYYQVKIADEKFVIVFSDKKDLDNAMVLKPSDPDKPLEGNVILKMNRKDYPVSYK